MKMSKGSGQLTTRIKLSSGERGYLTTWYLEFYAGSEMTVMAIAEMPGTRSTNLQVTGVCGQEGLHLGLRKVSKNYRLQ